MFPCTDLFIHLCSLVYSLWIPSRLLHSRISLLPTRVKLMFSFQFLCFKGHVKNRSDYRNQRFGALVLWWMKLFKYEILLSPSLHFKQFQCIAAEFFKLLEKVGNCKAKKLNIITSANQFIRLNESTSEIELPFPHKLGSPFNHKQAFSVEMCIIWSNCEARLAVPVQLWCVYINKHHGTQDKTAWINLLVMPTHTFLLLCTPFFQSWISVQ